VTVEVVCERAASFGRVTAPALLPEYTARKSIRRFRRCEPHSRFLATHAAASAQASLHDSAGSGYGNHLRDGVIVRSARNGTSPQRVHMNDSARRSARQQPRIGSTIRDVAAGSE